MAKRMKSSRYPQTMATQSRNLLRLALGVALLLSLALLALAFAAARANALAVTYDGIAADGHLALFSTAEKMVPGDTDNQPDVYVRSKDETLGEPVTREVSIGPADGNDAQPVQYDGVSSDGEKVFFSTKEGLVASDKDGQEDIYMRNLETNATTLVSQRDSSCLTEGCGGPLAGAGFVPGGVIPSGDRVFFATTEKLSGEDGDGALDVYMRDIVGGKTVLISQGDSSCPGSGCGDGPLGAIFKKASEDGEKVFFTSSEDLAAGDEDGRIDIYERDLEGAGSTVLVSPLVDCPAGLPSGQNCDPSYRGASSDGSHVFFESNEQISGADTDTSQDVYDWSGSGPAALVSTGPSGGNGAPNATYAGTSGTGGRAYFETSEAVDPVADTDTVRDVYERSNGETTTLISTGPTDGNGPKPALFEWASPDGSSSSVIFSTEETLTVGDTDGGAQDLYRRSGTETTLISTGPEGSSGPPSASFEDASKDGSHVYFSTAEALLGEDEDANADIYLRSGTETALVSTGTIGGNGAFSAGLFGVSADGSMGFFVTRERLAADDDFLNEEDVYSWAAPKSLGSSAKTLLVSVKNSGELVLGPPPPFLKGTNPATSGETTEPRVLGQAEAGATIKVYTSPSCSGEPAPPGGTATELAGAGIPVTVAAATKTTFYATAEVKGIVSPCSNGVSYTQATPEPPPPAGEEGGNKEGGGTTPGSNGTRGNGTGGAGGNGHGFTFVTPQTRITFGPASKTKKRKVAFRFVDSTEQPGTKFLCKVDRRHWKECGSPDTLKRLGVGRHVFQVKAVNAIGTAEPAPQKRAFKVVK
jgi:Tol biopolymer transport system component